MFIICYLTIHLWSHGLAIRGAIHTLQQLSQPWLSHNPLNLNRLARVLIFWYINISEKDPSIWPGIILFVEQLSLPGFSELVPPRFVEKPVRVRSVLCWQTVWDLSQSFMKSIFCISFSPDSCTFLYGANGVKSGLYFLNGKWLFEREDTVAPFPLLK